MLLLFLRLLYVFSCFHFRIIVATEGVEEMLFEGAQETRQASKIIRVSYV